MMRRMLMTALGRLPRFLRVRLSSGIRRLRSPKMIWGYQDASGAWRERARISDSVVRNVPEKIFVGDGVFVGHYTVLDGTGGLTIGEGTAIGDLVGIFTHSVHVSWRVYGRHFEEVPDDEIKGFQNAPVRIGRYAMDGTGTTVLPGVTIGDGAAIKPGSVIKRDVGPFELVEGNPARVVGDMRNIDKRLLRNNPQLAEWYYEWQTD